MIYNLLMLTNKFTNLDTLKVPIINIIISNLLPIEFRNFLIQIYFI